MFPLQQAYEVRASVMEYLKATFRFKEKDVHDEFYRFLEDEKDGLFKGPYISLKTPFIKATPEEEKEIKLEIKPDFPPHKHQLQAFDRLHTVDGHNPEPTLLTTGTGSGKTECFLYPILDYCYKQNKDRKKRGVKVIIMYPMNALAQDQAKRIAEIIYGKDEEGKHPLRGVVDAGLFIGEGHNPAKYPTVMGHDHIIENRKAIIDSQPDIILTNFKMLDYALMKQEFQSLWKGNLNDEKQLKFLVLDELHTYDGAQGTDVANLIRRLKLKLHLEKGELCPIGTSATIGSGEENKKQLCDYATDVFGEDFNNDSIIEEHRVSVDDFFDTKLKAELPSEMQLKQCKIGDTGVNRYLETLRAVWLPKCSADPYQMGLALKELKIVRDLLAITSKGIVTIKELLEGLDDENKEFRAVYRHDEKNGIRIVESLLALISLAKQDEKNRFPFLYLQVQLWQRELSGILRYVSKEPKFTWRDSIDPNEEMVALPMYYCRDCGASGWITMRKATDKKFCTDIPEVNRAYMENSGDLLWMNTESERHDPVPEFMTESSENRSVFVHKKDLSDAAETDSDAMEVRVCIKKQAQNNKRPKVVQACPECNTEPLAFIGQKASTLSSVALSQIFASDFDVAQDKDRKVLCFTNSVQDAAHQAGFYEARTFRFLFRQSIQQYLKTQTKPISLAELQKGFKEFWKEKLEGDEYYYRLIPADLATRINLESDFRNSAGQFKNYFKEDFDLRVDWEICSEFGLTAQLGRTLEKTGASATYFEESKIKEVLTVITPWLNSNMLGYVAEQEKEFCHFVNGILHRIRIHGAVDHPYLYTYRTNKLGSFDVNKPRYPGQMTFYQLNKTFGGSIRYPKAISTGYMRSQNDIIECTATQNEKRPNWYRQYFMKCLCGIDQFGKGTIDVNAINEFFQQLFEAMVTVGLMNRKQSANGIANYMIDPNALLIEANVKHIRCDSCLSLMSVAQHDTLTKGMFCLDFKCKSRYQRMEDNQDFTYYKDVYNRESSPRIYADEHTGLLEREERVDLENNFKNHPYFNSTNVLCATSTLEMGIDIGDLNVVSNVSVPPKPSNFLQRVGRAGRKQGSALVMNYAHTGGEHDMYFFAEPKKMMEGDVNTPGCFLEARDILRRHFYAFCIDSWTSADSSNIISPRMGDVNLVLGTLDDENFFINRINAFIRQYRLTLLETFRKQYPDKTAEAMEKLADYVSSEDGLFLAIRNAFKKRINAFQHVKKECAEALEVKKRTAENDPAYVEIKDRVRSLSQQEAKMLDEPIIEFMTNEGLLPNYAFPEDGVKLIASIYEHAADYNDREKKAEVREIELSRPAPSGIKELAPNNYFYTQKHKLKITGVNSTDWDENLKIMRYCPECDCIAEATENNFLMKTCPKCGSAKWYGRTHKFLRFTEAHCITNKRESILDDNKDERLSENYHVMKHFMFRDEGSSKAYGLKRVGFGIQFCKDTEITEVNYGHTSQLGSPEDVNGRRVPGIGYIVCRYCGKATPIAGSGEADPAKLHDKFCKKREVPYPPEEKDKDTFECIYLYHKMQTEAIKILLPVQDFMETSASIQLFKAGIELGMRYYYQSSPDHIKIEEYHEKNRTTGQMDCYLVMYDTIPGGTGYLSKLFNKEEFGKLMRVAYEHIRDCTCQYEGKDGCYNCILTYGNQYSRQNLSRARAEELFEKIVEQVELWEDIDDGLGQLTQSGIVETSELERWFVEMMRKVAEKHDGWSWNVEQDAGDEKHYELHIKNDQTEILYSVRSQYDLGPALGVSDRTIPDFQFICKKAVIDGKEITDIDKEIPQWAVYTDGFKYHATEECPRFYGDFRKREAIKNRKQTEETGNYKMLTWTLTWDDLDNYQKKNSEGYKSDGMNIPFAKRNENFQSKIQDFTNNFERMLYMLQNPVLKTITDDLKMYLANYMVGEPSEDLMVKTDFIPTSSSIVSGELKLQITEDGDDMIPSFSWVMTQGLQQINKDDWMDFWRRYNILQFFECESTETIQAPVSEESLAPHESHVYDSFIDYYPEEYQPLVIKACNKGLTVQDGGDFNITDEDGTTVASAEFGIESEKWMIKPYGDVDRQNFAKYGYTEYNIEEADNKLDE